MDNLRRMDRQTLWNGQTAHPKGHGIIPFQQHHCIRLFVYRVLERLRPSNHNTMIHDSIYMYMYIKYMYVHVHAYHMHTNTNGGAFPNSNGQDFNFFNDYKCNNYH